MGNRAIANRRLLRNAARTSRCFSMSLSYLVQWVPIPNNKILLPAQQYSTMRLCYLRLCSTRSCWFVTLLLPLSCKLTNLARVKAGPYRETNAHKCRVGWPHGWPAGHQGEIRLTAVKIRFGSTFLGRCLNTFAYFLFLYAWATRSYQDLCAFHEGF